MRLRRPASLTPMAAAVLTAVAVAGLPIVTDRLTPAKPPAPAVAAAAAPSPASARARTSAPVGYDTVVVRRGNAWLLRNSLAARGGQTGYLEATRGWVPLAGDFDGNGSDSLVLWASGVWLLSNERGGPYNRVPFGRRGDRPVVGDWDGDGRDSLGVVRDGRWYLRGHRPFVFGRAGDVPVVGDWNGDGRTDTGVRRGRQFLLRNAAGPGRVSRVITYGDAGLRPVVGDWDHDGRDDVGLFRSGVWSFRMPDGRTQRGAFGRAGDLPVVRRVSSLTGGLSHRVVRRYGSVAQVVTVALPASSTPDTVLASNRLGSLERTSSMAARTGALVAVNGDFAAYSGRPIHSYGADGALMQRSGGGSGLGLTRGGARARTAVPSVSVTLTPYGQLPRTVQRFNQGTPRGNQLAAYTATSTGVERPPHGACYAVLSPTGARFTSAAGGVKRMMEVLGTRCGGRAAAVPRTGVLVVAPPSGSGSGFVRALQGGQLVAMEQLLGYAGSVSLLGGSEHLVADGRVRTAAISAPGAYSRGRQPRTVVGVTGGGRLLVVTVDGRRRGWSRGMTLVQVAGLMRDLGAREAINLDGGGSTTMVLNGLIVNRPSDGRERRVSSGLVVLRGNDPGQGALNVGPLPLPPPPPLFPRPPAPGQPLQPLVPGVLPGIPGLLPVAAPSSVRTLRTQDGRRVTTTQDWVDAARDPGSTGGLAESRQLAGSPLDDTLSLAVQLLQGLLGPTGS